MAGRKDAGYLTGKKLAQNLFTIFILWQEGKFVAD